ncbi:MotA/TolQ/ExbB proton channel [Denitrovibrio acetiphilus DSM 12809]|jgi:biopolymer transport protein ExbB|uniref:MotA/TolQ/ExbB proton channel n=1 Tax=Denitrovibrio acetiphilus (strain DSM 12809 / NBRC 114555 / N2460) TaxID=522772 RepID=D4H775_DENA2|nr:MotA/TolQ/ExbB proton channel family protein [Denitrovibrio acetiphilus]ADD67874.1 MotA/TolQ/ExbB proton channel [Denitrovibrio acetiphilus DSM 12809]
MLDFNMELIQKGGVLMYPIIFLSVLALAVFLERLVTLRTSRYVPALLKEKIKQALQNNDTKEAISMCEKDGSALANVCTDLLKNLDLPLQRLMETVEESGRFQSNRLTRFLPTLQAIASIAPLLGLLGTVLGMIKTFIVIGQQGVGNAQALAGGISEALITTAAGLSVAIPTVVFYYIVRFRSDRVMIELERAVSEIINQIFKEA